MAQAKKNKLYISKDFRGQTLRLYASKAMYWQEEFILIIADMHLGKASHFRKNGIAIPTQLQHTTLLHFFKLMNTVKPKEVYFLGDLFHSVINKEWDEFVGLIKKYDGIKFNLIGGNHDILPRQRYVDAGIKWLKEPYVRGPFCFCHHPDISGAKDMGYVVAGHVHPGYLLKGKARQGLRFPSFHFGKEMVLLPAFGDFTGAVNMRKYREDDVYICVNERLVRKVP